MRFLTTAAMALALTGAAAAAHAEQPQNGQNAQQQGGQQHGGQPHGGGGQPHGQGGGQRNFAGPQGHQPGGQPNWQGQGGRRFDPQAAQAPQPGAQPRNWQGQGVQHFNAQAAPGQALQGGQDRNWQEHGGQPRDWHGLGGERWQGRGQPNAEAQQRWQAQQNGQVQRWNRQGGQSWQGQRSGGFGWQNHGLRGRDQGRAYYSTGDFARSYHAERRFRFGGYRYAPSGWYFRTWNFGDFLPGSWFAPEYYLDWADYGLPPPPIGCEWIAEGPDAVLVDIWTGEVLTVYRGLFWWNGY